MNVIINDQAIGEFVQIKPTTTVGQMKDFINQRYGGGTIVGITFNDGQVLGEEVLRTNKYDHVSMEYYVNNGLVDGSRVMINIPVPTVIQPPVQPGQASPRTLRLLEQQIQLEPIANQQVVGRRRRAADHRQELIHRISRYLIGIIDTPGDYDRIINTGEYEEFIREFPTYDEFVRKQRDYVENSTTEDLIFYDTLIVKLRGKMDYMDMEDAVPGKTPDFFFLMPGGKIVIASEAD